MKKNGQERFRAEVLDFLRKYYGKHKKIPSTATLFRSFNKTRFYEVFLEGLAQACKAAGIPVPEERLKQTQKARQAAKKKRLGEPEEATLIQDVRESYAIQMREEQRRKDFSRKRAEEIAILLQDPNEAISHPFVDAIENIALPVLLEKKYGIEATVPEILEMVKPYKQAKDEGWCVKWIMAWGLLSEEEREAFGEFYNESYSEAGVDPTRYLPTLEDKVEKIKTKINQLSIKEHTLTLTVQSLQRDRDNLIRNNKWQEEALKSSYEHKRKALVDKYLVDMRACADEFSSFIEKVEASRNKAKKDSEIWKANRDKLRTAFNELESKFKETITELDLARKELKQLRQTVGPAGTVTDLSNEKDRLKQQNEELQQKLSDISIGLAGKWFTQEEAFLTVKQQYAKFLEYVEHTFLLISEETERRLANAGAGLYVIEFLNHDLPPRKLNKLASLVMMAQLKRESSNPDNPFFTSIPRNKKAFLRDFPTREEFKRAHRERIEIFRKRWQADLHQKRLVAFDMSKVQTAATIGEGVLETFAPVVVPFLEDLVESLLNPKTALNNSEKNEQNDRAVRKDP